MYQNRWRLGLRPRPRWGSLQRYPRPPSCYGLGWRFGSHSCEGQLCASSLVTGAPLLFWGWLRACIILYIHIHIKSHNSAPWFAGQCSPRMDFNYTIRPTNFFSLTRLVLPQTKIKFDTNVHAGSIFWDYDILLIQFRRIKTESLGVNQLGPFEDPSLDGLH